MDKLSNYQDILVNYLNEYAKIKPVNLPNVENKVLTDRANNHFQLMRSGWDEDRFIFSVLFHFDIQDGKILILRNNTEREIIEELIERGVDRSDIVLGFVPTYFHEQLDLA